MKSQIGYPIAGIVFFLFLLAIRYWREAALDYKKANDTNAKALAESQAQVAALQRIIRDLHGIYSLLTNRQSQSSNDQLTQLELLTQITDDLVQRELKLRTELNQILARPALTNRELKEAIEEVLK